MISGQSLQAPKTLDLTLVNANVKSAYISAMTSEQQFDLLIAKIEVIERQNEAIIGLLARLVWKPDDIAEIVSKGKRNPTAYRKVYNSLDGEKTGKALALQAGVTPAAISYLSPKLG